MRCLVAAAWRRRAAAAAARRLAYLQKTRLLIFEFSLCLSRACLGKMIIFSIKWRKKRVSLLTLQDVFVLLVGGQT
jgi:hypothetical protein